MDGHERLVGGGRSAGEKLEPESWVVESESWTGESESWTGER